MKSQKSKIEDAVMERIQMGEVKMKPRWYFVMGSGLVITGLGVLGVGLVFLINISIFLLRKHGPGGQWRLEAMIGSFPWWIPVLAVTGVVIGVCLLRKYDFSYKKNFGLIVVGLIAAITICAWLVDLTGINDKWSKRGPMRRLYQQRQNFGL